MQVEVVDLSAGETPVMLVTLDKITLDQRARPGILTLLTELNYHVTAAK